MEKLIKINKEDRLYIVGAAGGGYSCLGFDVLHRRAAALSAEMGLAYMLDRGTKAAFTQYGILLDLALDVNKRTGYRFSCELSPQLMGLEGRRVEVVTTYGEKKRFNVGKSTGFIPCHLEISRRGCSGGMSAEHEYKSVRIVR